jgi:hypothetical protein
MHDILEVIKNTESLYNSNTAMSVLKDYERVIDELDLYVYENWKNGELAVGPNIDRHWVSCTFMWPLKEMPDPMGGKRLLDYGCKVNYKKSHILVPRKIRTPDDIRPMSKKGKLDRLPIWMVEVRMPKKLIADIWGGYQKNLDAQLDPIKPLVPKAQETQPADEAMGGTEAPAPEEAGGESPGGTI